MLRFLATLVGIVVVVWALSLFASPSMHVVEGRDITTPDPTGPAPAPHVVEKKIAAAAEKREEKKVEWKSKDGKGKKGEGKRKRD